MRDIARSVESFVAERLFKLFLAAANSGEVIQSSAAKKSVLISKSWKSTEDRGPAKSGTFELLDIFGRVGFVIGNSVVGLDR